MDAQNMQELLDFHVEELSKNYLLQFDEQCAFEKADNKEN